MKYKIIGFTSIILAFLMVIVVCFLTSEPEDSSVRYHQHLEAETPKACNHNNEVFCTHLPLMEIYTPEGVEIPGRAIVDSATGLTIAYEKTPDGKDEIIAKIEITSKDGVNHHIKDTPDLISDAVVHARGNSS